MLNWIDRLNIGIKKNLKKVFFGLGHKNNNPSHVF